MNFKTFFYASTIISSLLSQSAFAEQHAITFKNQRGSILELNILADNKIEGYFTTAVAPNLPHQCDSSEQFEIKKHKNILLIQFSILNKQAVDITHEGPGSTFYWS